MRKSRPCLRIIFVYLTLAFLPSLSFGWGQDGHKIVAYVGSQITTGKGSLFWKANSQNFLILTGVPDFYWKRGPLNELETVTHYFQPDSYFKDPIDFSKIPHNFLEVSKIVGKQNAIEFGTASWRIGQFYEQALTALKKQNYKTALELAGVMSHYIGDLSQPLHVTENYDGQKTNNRGIHSFFETANIRPYANELVKPVAISALRLLRSPDYLKQFKGSVVDASFNETFRAYSFIRLLIEIDTKLGRKGTGARNQLLLAQERLADGAAALSIVLNRLWEESGQNEMGSSIQITIPEWIKPNYYDFNQQLKEQIEYKTRSLLIGDDCA